MTALKNVLDTIDITLLNIDFFTVGKEWNYWNVNNPYSRIYYITEGRGMIQHHSMQYDLLPDCLYLIPCYTTVDLICPERFSHFYVHFTTRMQTGLDIFSIFPCDYRSEGRGISFNRQLFERLLALNPNKELTEYDANKSIYKQVLDRANRLDQEKSLSNILETNAILRLLLSLFFSRCDHPQTYNTFHGLVRFEKVLTFIQENLECPITIQRLADMTNLNPIYFSNLFSKLMGLSPIQYVNKRRIEKAQKLLLGTSDTLYKIAQAVGFADEYYFSRVFKKTVGIAPDHYRKQEILHYRR